MKFRELESGLYKITYFKQKFSPWGLQDISYIGLSQVTRLKFCGHLINPFYKSTETSLTWWTESENILSYLTDEVLLLQEKQKKM